MNGRTGRGLLFSALAVLLGAAFLVRSNRPLPESGPRESNRATPQLLAESGESKASLPAEALRSLPFRKEILRKRLARQAKPIYPSAGAGFEIRDHHAAVRFTDEGMTLALLSADRSKGHTIRWRPANMPRVEPKAEGMQPGKVNVLVGPRENWRTDLPTYTGVRYAEVSAGTDLTIESRPQAVKYSLYAGPGETRRSFRFTYEGVEELRLIDGGAGLLVRTTTGDLKEHGLVAYQTDDSGARRDVPARYASLRRIAGGWEYTIVAENLDPARPLVVDPTLDYSTYRGASGTENGNGIAIDTSGNAYIVGTAPGASADTDAFVVKYSPSGSIVYEATFGGVGSETGLGIVVDTGNRACFVGSTTGGIATPQGFDTVFGGGTTDGYMAALNATGTSVDYATYVGGANIDDTRAIAVDSADQIYVTGATQSNEGQDAFLGVAFPAGSMDPSYNGGGDAYVVKINTSVSGAGSLVAATYIGKKDEGFPTKSTGDDEGYAIAVHTDTAGQTTVFVAGSTVMGGATNNFLTSPGAFQVSPPGPDGFNDGFVTKIKGDLTALVFSTYLGGTQGAATEDIIYAIALRVGEGGPNNPLVYVGGETSSTDFPTTASAFDTQFNGGLSDGFATVLDPSGSFLLFSTYLGGSGMDRVRGIAVDAFGNIVVGGTTTSADFPTEDPFQPTLQGGNEGFISTLSPDGTSLIYSTYLGGKLGDDLSALALKGNKLAVTGLTLSTDFPTLNAAQSGNGGGQDAFVSRFTIDVTPAAPEDVIVFTNPEGEPIGDAQPGDTITGSINAVNLTSFIVGVGTNPGTNDVIPGVSTPATFAITGVPDGNWIVNVFATDVLNQDVVFWRPFKIHPTIIRPIDPCRKAAIPLVPEKDVEIQRYELAVRDKTHLLKSVKLNVSVTVGDPDLGLGNLYSKVQLCQIICGKVGPAIASVNLTTNVATVTQPVAIGPGQWRPIVLCGTPLATLPTATVSTSLQSVQLTSGNTNQFVTAAIATEQLVITKGETTPTPCLEVERGPALPVTQTAGQGQSIPVLQYRVTAFGNDLTVTSLRAHIVNVAGTLNASDIAEARLVRDANGNGIDDDGASNLLGTITNPLTLPLVFGSLGQLITVGSPELWLVVLDFNGGLPLTGTKFFGRTTPLGDITVTETTCVRGCPVTRPEITIATKPSRLLFCGEACTDVEALPFSQDVAIGELTAVVFGPEDVDWQQANFVISGTGPSNHVASATLWKLDANGVPIAAIATVSSPVFSPSTPLTFNFTETIAPFIPTKYRLTFTFGSWQLAIGETKTYHASIDPMATLPTPSIVAQSASALPAKPYGKFIDGCTITFKDPRGDWGSEKQDTFLPCGASVGGRPFASGLLVWLAALGLGLLGLAAGRKHRAVFAGIAAFLLAASAAFAQETELDPERPGKPTLVAPAEGHEFSLLYPVEQQALGFQPLRIGNNHFLQAQYGFIPMETATTLPEWRMHVGLFTDVSHGDITIDTPEYFFRYDATLVQNELEVRLGLPWEFEAKLSIEFSALVENGDLAATGVDDIFLFKNPGTPVVVEHRRHTGFGDLRLGIKRPLLSFPVPFLGMKPNRGTLGLALGLKIPISGDDVEEFLSSGGVDVAVSVLYTQELGPFLLHLNLGGLFPSDPEIFGIDVETRTFAWTAGVSVVYPFAEWGLVSLQIQGHESVYDGSANSLPILDHPRGSAHLGGRFRIGSYFLEVSGGLGFNDLSSEFGFAVSLSLPFDFSEKKGR